MQWVPLWWLYCPCLYPSSLQWHQDGSLTPPVTTWQIVYSSHVSLKKKISVMYYCSFSLLKYHVPYVKSIFKWVEVMEWVTELKHCGIQIICNFKVASEFFKTKWTNEYKQHRNLYIKKEIVFNTKSVYIVGCSCDTSPLLW